MTKNNAKKQSVTDRQTDRPTDGAGCRVACTRLKSARDQNKEDRPWHYPTQYVRTKMTSGDRQKQTGKSPFPTKEFHFQKFFEQHKARASGRWWTSKTAICKWGRFWKYRANIHALVTRIWIYPLKSKWQHRDESYQDANTHRYASAASWTWWSRRASFRMKACHFGAARRIHFSPWFPHLPSFSPTT